VTGSKSGDAAYEILRVDGSARLPYSLKVLLENLLRNRGRHAGDRRGGRPGGDARAVKPGQSRASLGLTGEELYSITGLEGTDPLPHEVTVRAEKNGDRTEFSAAVRIDTPAEAAYFRHGGILQFVLRQLLETNDTRR
jgi:aconitase A